MLKEHELTARAVAKKMSEKICEILLKDREK